MTARRWALLAIAAVAVAALGLALMSRDRGMSHAPAAQAASTPRAVAQAPAPLAAQRVPDGPFDVMRPRLEAAAREGDADAAFRIGKVLAHCLHYSPVAHGELAGMLAEAAATAGSSVTIDGRPLGNARNIDLMLFAQQEAQRHCADTDSIRSQPPEADAFHFVSMAAERGHAAAMTLYPDLAFREFASLHALIDNADEVERRRLRAREMLETAVRKGEPEALMAASRAYSHEGWLTPDPERALAFWLAYMHTPDARRIPDTLASERLGQLEDAASPAQRSRAAEQATRIRQTFQVR